MANDIICEISSENELICEMSSAGEIVVEISGMTYQSVAAELAGKASVEDVALKADKTYVDSQDALKADLADLALKADKTYVDSQDLLKADKAYVDTKLSEKANKQQEAWITPTLLNGWTSSDPTRTIKYMKDEFGIVHMQGSMKSGVTDEVFTLPLGYRPKPALIYFGVYNANKGMFYPCRITNLGVVAIASTDVTHISLDSISFPTF